MKFRLVDHWRSAWRWFSVQAFAVQGAGAAAWVMVPDDLRAAVPAEYMAIAAVVLAILGIIGRLTPQRDPDA